MTAAGRIPADTLEAALALAGVGCWRWNRRQQVLQVSAHFHDLVACPPEAIPASLTGWLALAHADDRAPLQELLQQLDTDSEQFPPPFTCRLRYHGGGPWRWFDVRAERQTDSDHVVVTFRDISQQKQAESALRDSQLRFRALYSTAPLAFIVWDRHGYISEWNRRAETIFGWNAGAVIGKQIHHLLLPSETHGAFQRTIQDLIQRGGDGIYAGPALAQDGLLRHCNWYNVALRAQNGKLTGILSLVLDVTIPFQAHQQLEKSEKIYRTLVETSPDAILLLDLKGRIQMANQQAQRLFAIDPMADRTSLNIRHLVAGDAPDQFLDDPDECVGFIATRQLRMRSQEGHEFDAATAYSTVMNSRGKSSGMVLFVRDISAQIQAERELAAHRENLERLVQKRTAELENAHNALSKIVDGSPVPTFVIDADHTITHWNRACEQIIGLSAQEMVGTREAWRGFYPAQRPVMADLVLIGAVAKLHTLYADRFRPSEMIEGGYEAEDYFPTFHRWLFFTAAPLRDPQGNIIGAIETLQDITERKQAEIALKAAIQTAESAAAAKATFLANMSHEIRTPMNAVIGLAHLLLKEELSRKQRDYVARIHGAGQMLLGLINDILDFSKIEAGRMELESTAFQLDDVLDEVANVLMHRAQEKGLELLYVVEPDVPPGLIGDPLRLTQILINLIGNALKFTARGSVTLFVRQTRLAAPEATLEFAIQDTGIGMNSEQLAGLFEAFSQADSSITRQYGGTGLGLTICKRLVELMQGEIWVTSQPGVGSTFSFNAHFGMTPEAAESAGLPRQHALVVDDNQLARNILIRLLEQHGYAAHPAASGQAALDELFSKRVRYDLVSIDLNMPGMDGLELAAAIQERIDPPPRLVMITASDTSNLEHESRLRHFDAVINKPLTAGQIGRLVSSKPSLPAPSANDPAPLAGMRILLVEDIRTNQLIASEILTALGCTVEIADNGRVALNRLDDEHQQYDVVLMDVQMPEMDGLEATRRLRANARHADLPVIAMTAHSLESERMRCKAAGMTGFLTKPIDPAHLQTTLQRWRPALPPHRLAPIRENKIMNSPEGLPELPGIDTQEGLRRMMNKPSLYEKVLRDFHHRFQDETAQISALISAGDFATANRRAHSAKGLAGSIGANALQAAARDLELALEAGSLPPAETVAHFDDALRVVLDGIAAGFNLGSAS